MSLPSAPVVSGEAPQGRAWRSETPGGTDWSEELFSGSLSPAPSSSAAALLAVSAGPPSPRPRRPDSGAAVDPFAEALLPPEQPSPPPEELPDDEALQALVVHDEEPEPEP